MADPVLQSPRNPHFFKPLLPGFESHINFPDKFFSLHIQGRNERQTVNLRSDACETTWKVKMEGQKLTVGWKEFALAHDFRDGDIIIFRHDGDFLFHVTGLGLSCSEIEYVSCNLGDNDDDEEEEENIRNLPTKHNLETEPELSSGKPPRKKQVKKRNHEVEAVSFSSDESCFIRHVTDSNLREDALSLPTKLVGLLNKRNDKVVLMNEEGLKSWMLALRFKKSSRSFYMRAGWRIFCHENGLKSGDSVTFKLESNTKTPLLCFSTAKSKNVISTKNLGQGKRIQTGESSQRASSSSNNNRFVTLKVTPAVSKTVEFFYR